MVVVRLARGGAKKRPFYHIVVADSRFANGGRHIEKLGFFNPIASGQAFKLQLQREKLEEWVKKGAQLSPRVKTLVAEFDKTAVVA